MIKRLKELNPDLQIYGLDDPAFGRYGCRLTEVDFSGYIDIMANRPIPEEGNIYVGEDVELTNCEITAEIAARYYGCMPVQAGYCNGNSNTLDALEYHKGSEINVAVTDLVLLIGDVRDIKANTYPADKVEAFYLPAGSACELYGTTLHFAPCRVHDRGFKSIILLPAGTNQPLDPLPRPLCPEARLLWMQGKWLIAHPDSRPASLGAYAGITGKNIQLKYKI